jgi:hypothetical protein
MATGSGRAASKASGMLNRNSSCSIMWAEKSRSLSSSSGENTTRAPAAIATTRPSRRRGSSGRRYECTPKRVHAIKHRIERTSAAK